MDHRPFEDWLLNNQNLSADEKRQLNAHLQGCSSCSALAEVNLALKSVKMAEPAAGFAERFQVRLEAQKKALRRRNFWGFLLLTLSVLSGPGMDHLAGTQEPDPIAGGLAGILAFHDCFHLGQRRSPVPGRPGNTQGTPGFYTDLCVDNGPAGCRRMEFFMGCLVEEICRRYPQGA